jgi:uncharacterized protein YlxP (DUF503 family)
MIIAALELTITFYATSLKDKRSVVRRVLSRVRSTFNVSAAEVDELDNPGGAVLGFCSCGNDKRDLEGRLQALERFVDGLELCEITDSQRTITVSDGYGDLSDDDDDDDDDDDVGDIDSDRVVGVVKD